MDQSTISKHIDLAAHCGQTDMAGARHNGHIQRMMRHLLRRWPGATEDEIATAWRHDVVEETHCDTLTLIQANVSRGADNVATLIVKECHGQ